ncbi:MAG: retinol dehydrogenase [Myxococcota bacterium]|nr:retinol dehydrogenase [Myxococcota bacterium]
MIGVVVNANARKNRKRPSLVRELRGALGADGRVIVTRHLDELRPAVEAHLADGCRVLVASGGDGALHRMANVLLELRDEGKVDAWPPLVPTNGGTIDFVAKKVGLRGDAVTILRRLRLAARAGELERVSIPSLELRGTELRSGNTRREGEERAFRRVGFALAAGGVGQRFFEQYYALEDPGPPSIVKVVGKVAASQVARTALPVPAHLAGPSARMFEPTRARVSIDGIPVEGELHGALHAGAFYLDLGGVFRFFPLATEGKIHFHAGPVAPWEVIGSLPRMALGRRLRARGLVERAGHEMIVEALETPLSPIVDGESYEGVVRLEVRPGPPLDIAIV